TPNQTAVQMQQNGWPSPDPYQDPYRRGYSNPGADYTCPQPSFIVGAPTGTAPPPASAPQPDSPVGSATASNASASSAAPLYTSQDPIPAQAPSANDPSAKPYAILTCGTFVRLEFASPISSKTARVGDPVTLRVTDDIKVGTTVVVPRGTLADGSITFVRRTSGGGMPGTLAFRLNSLHVNGTSVPLWHVEGLSGDPKIPGAEVLIPVAGVFTLFRHGKDAELKPGMPITALVAADTTLPLVP